MEDELGECNHFKYLSLFSIKKKRLVTLRSSHFHEVCIGLPSVTQNLFSRGKVLLGRMLYPLSSSVLVSVTMLLGSIALTLFSVIGVYLFEVIERGRDRAL